MPHVLNRCLDLDRKVMYPWFMGVWPFRMLPMTKPVPPAVEIPPCDITRKFVRIKDTRPDGLVCFEFSIGWPELSVDLMLPRSAFDEFCVQQQVQPLSD